MENVVDGLHGEGLLHLDDEEVDHFFIRLQQIDGVVALADQNLSLLVGQEFGVFFVDYRGVLEFEGGVHQREIVRVEVRQPLV